MAQRAQYSARVGDFLDEPADSILGKLTATSAHNVELPQRNAWLDEITILKQQLAGYCEGHLFLEFSIPRMGKRADAVVIIEGLIFVIEFKVGATEFLAADRAQAIDYALDLLNFHEGSHDASLVPILVATAAAPSGDSPQIAKKGVASCVDASVGELHRLLREAVDQAVLAHLPPFDPGAWVQSNYKPTPTIVEAAQALYRDHDVSEISRSDASAKNLSETADEIAQIINFAKANGEKAICFVTGVPGAGKTLAGLSVTTSQMNHAEDEHAVFLSGNGPLVKVLREALAKDLNEREGIAMGEARRRTKTFVQNIHHFRDDSLETDSPPPDRVVVFDEAQRAWDHHHTVKFMRQKKGQPDFDASEPEFLIEVLDRHEDWCVIVALVGGGQEINSGEAGLSEWFFALQKRFRDWKVYHSSLMTSNEYAGDLDFGQLVEGLDSHPREALHLGVSIRSFRAGRLSEFVHHLIDNEPSKAHDCYHAIRANYPIFLTRSFRTAQHWLRSKTRGNELSGLIASSGARRLKPEGIDVKSPVEPEVWFLNGPEDVRACQYLEQVATEFDIQGLELDWAGVAWDADLRRDGSEWACRRFVGTKWQNVNQEIKQQYLKNAYRVLLTRARQGMVIYVPSGDADDPTRLPEFYDPIADYLTEAGIPYIEELATPGAQDRC
jgi:hypothetical protein